MPALPTHLVRIGAVYKYRARIPQDLQRYYGGKKEVTESLHTKNLVEAKRLLPSVQTNVCAQGYRSEVPAKANAL